MTLTTPEGEIIPNPEGEENTTSTVGEEKILYPEGARSIRNQRPNSRYFGPKWTNMARDQIQKAKTRTLNNALIPILFWITRIQDGITLSM